MTLLRERGPLARLATPAVLIPVLVLMVGGLIAAAYLYQPWRLFTSDTVNEAPPSTAAPGPGQGTGSAAAEKGSATLSAGSFISQAHGTSGTARVIRLDDGSRVLRLEGLETSDGPDLKVWLTDAPATAAGADAVDDGGYLSLGDLKANRGNQNYPIPDGVDLTRLTTVSIWCDRFDVSFGAAPLTA